MSDEKKTKAKAKEQAAEDREAKKRNRAANAKAAVAGLRNTIAKIVGWVFVLIALFLALAVLLVALRHNVTSTNPVVQFVKGVANFFDGPFKANGHGVFNFHKHGHPNKTMNALTNWGIAAILYVVVGRVLAKIIRA